MKKLNSLLEDLGNPDWLRRKETISAVLGFPEDAYLPFVEAALKNHEDATLRNGSMEILRSMGEKATPLLVRLLGDPDWEARLFAANLLGDIKARDVIGALVAALDDAEVNVRIASVEALGKIGDPEAIDALSKMIDDEQWVAQAAINAIGEIGGEPAMTVLYRCLEKTKFSGMVFDAMEKTGDYRFIRLLTPHIGSGKFGVLALKAMVNIADRGKARPMPGYFSSLMPMLSELCRSPNPELKKAALMALSWSEDARAIPFLIDALCDDDIQEYAVSGLMGIGKKAVPAVIDALKDTGRPQRSIMAKLISMLGEHRALVQFARDEDPEVRVEAALALGRVPAKRSVELLSKLAADPEEEVREAARKSLDSLNGAR